MYVDDATSRLIHILFTRTESTFGYFEATRQHFARHGKPLAFYSDKASIFRIKSSAIDGICANTVSANRRVERAHLTMQDRLVRELRLEGI